MPTPSIHILCELRDGPWGGGNQFLKALRAHLRSVGAYSEDPSKADVVLVNGHQWSSYLWQIFSLKRSSHSVRLIHRVDGPMSIVRGGGESILVDKAIIIFNKFFSDGTIFQSGWSKNLCISGGMSQNKPYRIVLNASDPSIFYGPTKTSMSGKKIKIISSSWSQNFRKGFDVLQYLDNNLDFSQYEFTFVGNTPVSFKNFRHIHPLTSQNLANELRCHDIFLQTSHLEACSNGLIEAMSCGLVPVARNNSSHPEIVGLSGVLYEGVNDVIEAIATASENRDIYLLNKNKNINMNYVGCEYMNLAYEVINMPSNRPNFIHLLLTGFYLMSIYKSKFFMKLQALLKI